MAGTSRTQGQGQRTLPVRPVRYIIQVSGAEVQQLDKTRWTWWDVPQHVKVIHPKGTEPEGSRGWFDFPRTSGVLWPFVFDRLALFISPPQLPSTPPYTPCHRFISSFSSQSDRQRSDQRTPPFRPFDWHIPLHRATSSSAVKLVSTIFTILHPLRPLRLSAWRYPRETKRTAFHSSLCLTTT